MRLHQSSFKLTRYKLSHTVICQFTWWYLPKWQKNSDDITFWTEANSFSGHHCWLLCSINTCDSTATRFQKWWLLCSQKTFSPSPQFTSIWCIYVHTRNMFSSIIGNPQKFHSSILGWMHTFHENCLCLCSFTWF